MKSELFSNTEDGKRLESLKAQYRELIRMHYQTYTSDTLVLGHCNISKRRIYEIFDYTGLELAEKYGKQRDEFFTALSELIISPGQRKEFLHKFLSEPALNYFAHGKSTLSQDCFIQIPGEKRGRYVQIHMTMVETPGSEDITGILTVTDVTEKKIEEKVFYSAAALSCDFVSNLDLIEDRYRILSKSGNATCVPPDWGSHSERMQYMVETAILPEDVQVYCRELNPENILHRLSKEESYSFAFSIRDEKGEIFTKRIALSPVDLRLGRVCLVRTDITELLAKERKSKELVEQALEEARKANRAKSDFLSRMSHDIRTPLNGVIGMAELVMKENKDSRLQSDLEVIVSSGRFLLSLINDILDISRIESGKMELHPEPFLLSTFNQMIDAVIRPLMIEKQITFDYNMDCGLDCVLVDTVRFNQIFFNLLSNAVKFTPEKGHIAFTAVALSSEGETKWVRFSVKDNGIGMSPAFLEKLFEPFEQAGGYQYRMNQYQGTGLGLAIVKEIVSMMKGKISVESQQGKGSEFIVDLPLKKSQSPARKKGDAVLATGGTLSGKRILLVEDNEINQMVTTRLLESKDVVVTCVSDGQKAVDAFIQSKENTYDAILMDIRMPIMDGLEATQKIRSLNHPDAQTIPIIAMSANAYEEDQKLSLDSGMNDHLSKPVEPEVLFKILQKYVG